MVSPLGQLAGNGTSELCPPSLQVGIFQKGMEAEWLGETNGNIVFMEKGISPMVFTRSIDSFHIAFHYFCNTAHHKETMAFTYEANHP
jgi:hypothetical protein